MLRFVAAAGVTDMRTIERLTRVGSARVLYAVNHWER